MSEIQAALSADEWDRMEIDNGLIDSYRGRIWFNDEVMWTENLHGLAALALHRQEFGFSWEDVDDERSAYQNAVMLARYAQDRGDEAERLRLMGMAERHRHRADKLEALLPPREEPQA